MIIKYLNIILLKITKAFLFHKKCTHIDHSQPFLQNLQTYYPVIHNLFRTLVSLHWDHLIRKHTFSYEMKPGMMGISIKTLKLFVYALRDIVPALYNTHYLLCSSLAPVYHDNEEHCLTSSPICLLQRICFCASHVKKM